MPSPTRYPSRAPPASPWRVARSWASPVSGRPLALADPGAAGSCPRADRGGCGSLRGGLPRGDAEPADAHVHARRPLRAQRRVHDLETAPRGREATVAAGPARARMAQDATLRGQGVRPGRPHRGRLRSRPRAPGRQRSRRRHPGHRAPAWIRPISTRTARSRAPATLVFTGSMDWYPNEDAILYFIASHPPGAPAGSPRASRWRWWDETRRTGCRRPAPPPGFT